LCLNKIAAGVEGEASCAWILNVIKGEVCMSFDVSHHIPGVFLDLLKNPNEETRGIAYMAVYGATLDRTKELLACEIEAKLKEITGHGYYSFKRQWSYDDSEVLVMPQVSGTEGMDGDEKRAVLNKIILLDKAQMESIKCPPAVFNKTFFVGEQSLYINRVNVQRFAQTVFGPSMVPLKKAVTNVNLLGKIPLDLFDQEIKRYFYFDGWDVKECDVVEVKKKGFFDDLQGWFNSW
jgi:hypothetical protein